MKTVLFFYQLFAEGIVIKFLWSWFIAATFSIPELSIPNALGLSLVMTVLTKDPKDIIQSAKEEIDNPVAYYFVSFISPIFLLGMGWIIHLFM